MLFCNLAYVLHTEQCISVVLFRHVLLFFLVWCYGKCANGVPDDAPATVTGGTGLFASVLIESVTPAVTMTAEGYEFSIKGRGHCASSVLGST